MEAITTPKYKSLTITGPVSVDKVQQKPNINSFNILPGARLMGPTGAGKSSITRLTTYLLHNQFIEVLGLNSPEKISSGRLEGFTQSVSTYTLNNVKHKGAPVYLVDSPVMCALRVMMGKMWENERKGGAECTRNDEIRTKTTRNAKYEDDEGRRRRTGAKLRGKLVYSVVEIVQ
ncbi:hypothetical protein BJ165DRAFT_1404933 [Panaeolus papilionaceus]|nr:hypothetical protein BJ165DRAFT_1404933 [Panaeolus papilionaceus]